MISVLLRTSQVGMRSWSNDISKRPSLDFFSTYHIAVSRTDCQFGAALPKTPSRRKMTSRPSCTHATQFQSSVSDLIGISSNVLISSVVVFILATSMRTKSFVVGLLSRLIFSSLQSVFLAGGSPINCNVFLTWICCPRFPDTSYLGAIMNAQWYLFLVSHENDLSHIYEPDILIFTPRHLYRACPCK